MLVHHHLTEAQTAAVIDGRMVFSVADHHIMDPHQRTDDPQIGLEPGGEGHNRFLAHKFCQFRFQFQMHLQGTVQKTGTGAACTVLFDGTDSGFHDFRIGGQSQIVVGAQHDPALAFHHHFHILSGFQRMEIGIDPLFLGFIHPGTFSALFKNIHKSTELLLSIIMHCNYTAVCTVHLLFIII